MVAGILHPQRQEVNTAITRQGRNKVTESILIVGFRIAVMFVKL